MIDMVFQLIAFFMVLINFSQTERTDEIQLPDSILAKPPDERPAYQITLNLDEKAQVILAGHTIENVGVLGPYLDREVDYASRQNVAPNEVSVIIRSHRDNPMRSVLELIKKCQKSSLESFVFRVKE